jgi:hypothetical protein
MTYVKENCRGVADAAWDAQRSCPLQAAHALARRAGDEVEPLDRPMAALLSMALCAAQAQDAVAPEVGSTPQQVVVSASRYAQFISDLPQSVDVIGSSA